MKAASETILTNLLDGSPFIPHCLDAMLNHLCLPGLRHRGLRLRGEDLADLVERVMQPLHALNPGPGTHVMGDGLTDDGYLLHVIWHCGVAQGLTRMSH